MSYVVSFVGWTPPARYDGNPWIEARIEEAPDPTAGPWTQIDVLPLTPLDSDPGDPALRYLTTSNGTAPDLWYRIIFADTAGGTTEPTTPVQNIASETTPFASVDELARILKLRQPSQEQTRAMQRVLVTAAGEIRSEIDLADGDFLEAWQLDLCTTVNLDRAADLWRHTESIPGVLGALDESLALPVLRYSWERYAQRLAPLKDQWGIA